MIKIKKIGLSVGAAALVIAPLATVVSCGMDNSVGSWIGAHADLNTTVNTKNISAITAFNFDGSKSNLGTSDISNNQVQSRLIGTFVVDKPTISKNGYDSRPYKLKSDGTKVMDSNNIPVPNPHFGDLIDPVSSPIVYRSLELAKKVTLTIPGKGGGKSERIWFNKDSNFFDKTVAKAELETVAKNKGTSRNINSSYFKAQLNLATDIEFELKDVNYIDHNGAKTKYKVKARDFLCTFRAANFQFLAKDATKLDGGAYKEQYYGATKYFNANRAGQFGTSDETIKNLDNRYLWTIAGIDTNKLYGLKDITTLIDDEHLTPSNSILVKGSNSIHFELANGTHSLLWDKLLNSEVNNYTPRPVEFIKEQNKESWTRQHNLPKESSLAKMGFFTYGENYKRMLYAGSYYVSHNDTFRQKIVKNKHFWNTPFVNSEETINSYTTNYRTQDATLWPINQFNKFMQGVEYKLSAPEVALMTASERVKIYKNSSAMQYSFDLSKLTSGNQLVTTVNPVGKITKTHYLNDDFTKVMYGGTKAELEAGMNTVTAQMTTGLAFKSQLAALINWYSVKEMSKRQGDVWNFFTPPGARFVDPNGGTKTAAELVKKEITYYKLNDAKTVIEHAGEVTFEANKILYEAGGNERLKSAGYDDVVDQLKRLLGQVFDKDTKHHDISFTWPVRGGYSSKPMQNTYKLLAEFLEHVDLGKRFSFKIPELSGLDREGYNPDYTKDIVKAAASNDAFGTFQGWGSDSAAGIAWYAGVAILGTRSGSPLTQTLSLLSTMADKDGAAKLFPQSQKLGKEINKAFVDGMKSINTKITADETTKDHKSMLTKDEWMKLDGNSTKTQTQYDDAKAKLKAALAANVFDSLHELKNTEIVNVKDSFGKIGLEGYGKGILKSSYIEEMKTASSTWISKAFFNFSEPDSIVGRSAKDILDLELELRNLTGYAMTFERAFVIPTAKKPTVSFVKSWISFKPQAREGVSHLEEWRIK